MTLSEQSSSIPDGPVDRAFRVLQTVVAANGPIGVRELGRRTGLPRSTASRLVAKLEQLRMVDRTRDGDVIAGGALATLQIENSTTPLLRDRLQPLLIDLVNRFGENAALSVDDGDAMLYLSAVASENPVSVGDVAGQRQRFHLVAPGLVTMANWPKQRLTDYLEQPLIAATSFSVDEPTPLMKRIKKIRSDGFAWTNQELDVGVNGIAVPLIVDGELVATISLYGPSYRFSSDTHSALGPELANIVAQRLSD